MHARPKSVIAIYAADRCPLASPGEHERGLWNDGLEAGETLVSLSRIISCASGRIHALVCIAIAALLAVVLGACSFVPREGPLAREIERQSADNEYVTVDVDANIVRILAIETNIGLSQWLEKSQRIAPAATIGVGDALSITIWEAGEGGLFSSQQSKSATFPSVIVGRNGEISLPYAGPLQVSGKTPKSVQNLIVQKLDNKAIQPQAMVNIIKNEHNTVVMSGDVARPGRYPIALEGERILDAIANAGGTKFPARETYVTFMRDGVSGIQLVKTIVDDQRENIYVRRGDRIYLTHDPKRYTVLGAVTKPGIYLFEAAQVNVLEAVASAGGLLDSRADSSGLFVFRYEDPARLDKIGAKYVKLLNGRVPTVYRIDMSHARSYFFAQSFMLQDKDSVFVSNAKAVEVGKILRLINLATSSVGNVVGAGRRFDDN
jgi:polysaccharide export outer membrane protein